MKDIQSEEETGNPQDDLADMIDLRDPHGAPQSSAAAPAAAPNRVHEEADHNDENAQLAEYDFEDELAALEVSYGSGAGQLQALIDPCC